MPISLAIRPAITSADVDQVRALFQEYAEGLNIDLSFQNFVGELAGLPGDYAPPGGCLLLAEASGGLAGCVAVRPIDSGACEMKRLFVRPAFRGSGAGRALAEAAVAAGRRMGYCRMRLDTLRSLTAAVALYRSMGFREIPPYRFNPIPDVLYLEVDLAPAQVFKIGGAELDDPAFSQRFAGAIARIAGSGVRPLVVHGGGKELTALLAALDIESRFVDGLRVTDARTRDAALMVLSGLANKRLAAALIGAGVDAIGVSGVDAGLVRVAKTSDVLGFVGKPVDVRAPLLRDWLDRGLAPVIAPMSLGADGDIYNVNADHVAAAVAVAVGASLLTFVTNVPGVLDASGACLSSLTAAEAGQLIASGAIRGGMTPKVRSALEAVESGVGRARITDLDGVESDGGTVFVA